MRIIAILAALMLGTMSALVAEEPGAGPRDQKKGIEVADLALRELSGLLEPREGTAVGDLKVRDVREVLAEASVRLQELELLRDVKRLSWLMPGAGHFKAGDNGAGAAYLAAGITITAGTIVGAYFLLPEEVRFDRLNYFTDPYSEIEAAWKSQSLVDMLPSLGVLAGGFAVRALLSHFAADGATSLAAQKIRDGEIRFEPYAAADRLGLQATWRR